MNFIIVSYTFPPYGTVAGRRWYLLVNELLDLGYKVKVIAATQVEMSSPWLNEDHKNLDLTYLPSGFPKILSKVNLSIWGKVWFHICKKYVHLKNPGHPFDKGFFWVEKVKKVLSSNKWLSKKDTWVVLSGAPFTVFKLAKFVNARGAKSILDYRDPYTWNNGYGFDSLSIKRQAYELRQENLAAAQSSLILVPNLIMKNELVSKYKDYETKISILPHPVQDGLTKYQTIQFQSNEVRLIYAGRLYPECAKDYEEVLVWLSLNPNICITIYTDLKSVGIGLFQLFNCSPQISMNSQVSPSMLFQEVLSHHAYLVITPNRAKDYVTTKFPDLIKIGIPILLKSAEGELTKTVAMMPQVHLFDSPSDLGNLMELLPVLKEDVIRSQKFLTKYSGSAEQFIQLIKDL